MSNGDHQIVVERIALFNVKPGIDPSNMMDEINRSASLGLTIHYSAGKLLRCMSASLNFSHIIHCVFKSTDDPETYNSHPEHLRVVENVLPLIDNLMIVVWRSDDHHPLMNPGSVMRVTLLKLKEDLVDNDQKKKTTQSRSVGQNFSDHETAKGHSIVIITVFPESDAEIANSQVEFTESQLIVDYLVPSA